MNMNAGADESDLNAIPMEESGAERIICDGRPETSAEYDEFHGERVASVLETSVTDEDFKRLMEATSALDEDETLAWIKTNSGSFSPKTLIVDETNGRDLSLPQKSLGAVVMLRPFNEIAHLDTFLNAANEALEDGGYIWCHCSTAALHKKKIMEKWPPVLNSIVYFCHYLGHRVMPKARLTKRLYFALTKGKQLDYHRVEVLGRLYRAGYDVIDESFRGAHYFVAARKIKAPIKDDEPTGSPLIRLRRIGKDGKIIRVYKFRTMYSYSEYLQPYIYKYNSLAEGGKFADDYRVSRLGHFMRKYWIDELPMFINLIKGEMKLVGVRPLSQHYFSLYTPEMQELRIKVKPGLLPPFYYDKTRPKTIEDVQESERRYIEAYLQHPFRTDWRYFWGTFGNIVFKGARSK